MGAAREQRGRAQGWKGGCRKGIESGEGKDRRSQLPSTAAFTASCPSHLCARRWLLANTEELRAGLSQE